MKGIFCYRSKKGIVFLAKYESQSLFSVGRSILSFNSRDSNLLDIIVDTDEAHIEDELMNSYTGKRTDVFIGRYEKRHFKLSRLQLGRHTIKRTVDNLDYISSSGKTIDSRLQGILGSGFRLSSSSTLEDMLRLLYAASHDDKNVCQFGFIDKYSAKTLFSPETSLSLIPSNYKKRGEFNQKLFRANTGFYGLLVKNLELDLRLRDMQHDKGYKKSFINILKEKRIKRQKDSLEDNIGDIISRYLDYHHGPVERFTIGSFIKNLEDDKRKRAIPPKYSKGRQLSLQQKLDREYMPSGSRSLIIGLKKQSRYSKRAVEWAYHLEKELGMRVRPLINFPYLIINGSEKDVRKLYSSMRERRFGRFSRKGSALLSNTEKISYGHGVYIPELIAEFLNHGKMHKVVPIRARHRQLLWNLVNIGADRANSTTTGAGISVAVCDTGVDYEHHELRDRFGTNKGYDFIENNDDPMDRHYHGTHVAGTIAGMTTGVAPGCTLYAVRVLDEDGRGSLDGILQGVDWCITNNIDIANFSLGSASETSLEYDVFKQAYSKGLVSVAAAGNNYFGPSYPASYDCVVAVAAVDRNNDHADFSNIYYTNNVSAPGVEIYSTIPGNQYGLLSGTSMATPHIAGSAALVGSIQNNMDKDAFQKIIEETCLELGDINDPDYWSIFGCGLVQADKAVNYRGSRWMRLLSA